MSAEVDAKGFKADLADLYIEINKAAAKAVADATEAGYETAKETTLFNDRTGNLRRSIDKSVGKSADGDTGAFDAHTGSFQATASYAVWVENGTEPHIIEGSPLAFQMNGSMHFAYRVHHPGTQPRPFMEQAAYVAERVLEDAMEEHLSEAIRKHDHA